MIPQHFEYAAPTSIAEAVALLGSGGKPLAGGMSLVPMMKLRLAAPEHIVDLNRIAGLNLIDEQPDGIHIGAMTTYYQLETSELLRTKCPLLPETAHHIGDLQVRNMGTVGGSAAHADPAADLPATLVALEARMKITGAGGERTIGVEQFFVDTMTTALEPGDLLLEIIVPAETANTGVSYQKFRQPASGFAIVGVAARIQKVKGKVELARIGITGLSAKAFRATNVEQLIAATAGSAADIQKAAAVTAQAVDANSDLHASAAYRRHLAAVYTARALTEALTRAGA